MCANCSYEVADDGNRTANVTPGWAPFSECAKILVTAIKDTPKEDQPPNKGQARSTRVYTLYRKSPLKEDNLSTKWLVPKVSTVTPSVEGYRSLFVFSLPACLPVLLYDL